MTVVSSRLRLAITAMSAAAHESWAELDQVIVNTVLADINVTKPYKPRRLKLDPIHRMARQLYKMKAKHPDFIRKRKLYDKIYKRKNKMLLKRRAKFVRKSRQAKGLDKD